MARKRKAQDARKAFAMLASPNSTKSAMQRNMQRGGAGAGTGSSHLHPDLSSPKAMTGL